MDSLFTAVTVLLTSEYVDLFSPEKLVSKLSKVTAVTGVQFSKAKNTYALTGSWAQVNTAFELLTHWRDCPSEEPNDDVSSLEKNGTTASTDRPTSGDSVMQTDDKVKDAIGICKRKGRVFPNKHEQGLGKHTNIEMLQQAIFEGVQKNNNSSMEDMVNYMEKQVEKINMKHAERQQKKTRSRRVRGKHKSIRKNDSSINKASSVMRQGEIGAEINETMNSIEFDSLQQEHHNHTEKQQIKATECSATEDCPKEQSEIIDANDNTENEAPDALVEIRCTVPQTGFDSIGSTESRSKKTLKIKGRDFRECSGKNTSSHSTKLAQNITNSNTMQGNAEQSGSKDYKSCSHKKNTRKPGDNGYWSRVKIADYNEKHKCSKCDVVLKSRKRLMEHMRRIHIKGLKCEVCERRFGYPTDLNRHKCPGVLDPNNQFKEKGGRPKKVKIDEPLFLPCPECDYIGTSRKRFNGHVKRSHRAIFACDQCDKRFGFERDLFRHKENVHTEMSYFCDKCSRFYKSKAVFNLHLKTHENGYLKPKHECQVCSKSFTTKYVLGSHIKTEHLGLKKTYLCQICGKKFSQRNSYKQHSNAHAGIKPYVCDLCGKAFTYHKSLKEHKFMHDNIRRFQCNLCDKAFRQRTTLQIHMKVHKTVKDHICSTCGKGFSQKQALERHERIHTGIKPYMCIPCQRTFGDASTIRRHMLSIHQKTEINWREDTICTVRKKTDYYVQGGSGQNRTYNIKTKPSQAEHAVMADELKGKQHKNDTSATTLDSVDKAKDVEHNALNVSVHLNRDLAYGNVISEMGEQVQNLRPAVLNISQGTNLQQLNQLSPTSVLPLNYAPTPVLDFTNLSQMFGQQQQVAIEKDTPLIDESQQLLPDQSQMVVSQSGGMFQGATLVPIASLADVPRCGQGIPTQQLSGDTAVNQAMTSFWGLVGYPAYYNSAANLTQFQNSQNQ